MATVLERIAKRVLGHRYYDYFPTDHRNTVGGLWDVIGRLQFDYLVAQGLQPHHYLLDIGCGALRGGLHFVRYLEPGHYVGIDADPSLLAAGRAELRRARLEDRRPTLVAMSDFDVPSLQQQFEYALAQSVFTHLPLNGIQRCLARTAQVLAPGGRFYTTIFEAPAGAAALEPRAHRCADGSVITTHSDRDPYHYDFATLQWFCRALPLRPAYIGAWGHPRDQRLVVFVKT